MSKHGQSNLDLDPIADSSALADSIPVIDIGAVMADAYARISGRIPVVTAQNGPAATLLVAGLAEF